MIAGIIGAGAIGTLFGATLARSCDVRVLVRAKLDGRHIASRGGLVLDGDAPQHVEVSDEPEVLFGADVLVIAVKAYATVAALERLRGTPCAHVPIVSLQNGADAVSEIEFVFGHREAIALAPTTEGVALVEPGIARRTGIGSTAIGWARGHAGDNALLDALVLALGASLSVERVQPIEPFVWQKLIANAAINPVTAIAGIRNGEILNDPVLRERVAIIALEVAAVARASGIELPFEDPIAYVEGVVAATAANRSSMLVDREAGRQTEIEAIAGAVVRAAALRGVPVPETARAYGDVLALKPTV